MRARRVRRHTTEADADVRREERIRKERRVLLRSLLLQRPELKIR
jgi:hypothetical protein